MRNYRCIIVCLSDLLWYYPIILHTFPKKTSKENDKKYIRMQYLCSISDFDYEIILHISIFCLLTFKENIHDSWNNVFCYKKPKYFLAYHYHYHFEASIFKIGLRINEMGKWEFWVILNIEVTWNRQKNMLSLSATNRYFYGVPLT